jgi:hypothetical protein
MNLAQRIEWQNELRKVGIPWRSFPAVFTCALKINAGTTYLVAAKYAEAMLKGETFPQACMAYNGYRIRLWKLYACHAHETGRYRRDWARI